MKAKLVKESLDDILKPKSKEEIETNIDILLNDLASLGIEAYPEYFDDFLDAYEYFENNFNKIKQLIELGYSIEDIVDSFFQDFIF